MKLPWCVRATVLEQLTAWCRVVDDIDTVNLARLFGTTPGWVTLQAVRRKNGRSPRLICKRAPGGSVVRGADNRLLFDLEDVFAYVSDVERLVTRVEAPHFGSATLPLVSAMDPRIGTAWNALEMSGATAARRYFASKHPLHEPAAFFISNERRGYSVAWGDPRKGVLHPLVANDNVPATTHACGGAKP